MRRGWSATIACAGVVAMAVGLGANQQDGALPAGEQAFVVQAAMTNMAEIQLGHLAAKKAQQASVKKFAQRMVDDHVTAQQGLADAAYGGGIRWPNKLDDKHQQIQQRLSKLSDKQFDQEYMKAMIDTHRDAEKMLDARVSKGSRPVAGKVDQWAAKTLPQVRAHLNEAEQVFGELAKGE